MKNIKKGIICLSIISVMLSCRPVIYTTNAPPPPPQVVTAPPPQVVTPPPQQVVTPPPQQIVAPQQQVYAPPPPEYGAQASFQIFYDELAPYGTWVTFPSYGYVWIPKVGPEFEPYATNGHWVYTEQGWTWNSDYAWGWAAFHYGSWFFDNNFGWIWVPGHEWAPAWVTWGYYNNYYCWAPIEPGVTRYDNYRPPQERWHFVASNRIAEPNVNNYIVRNDRPVVDNVNSISVIDNRNSAEKDKPVYSRGPRREEVEKATQQKIVLVPVKETIKTVPVQKTTANRMQEKGNVHQDKAAPRSVEKLDNVKPYKKPNSDYQQKETKTEPNIKDSKGNEEINRKSNLQQKETKPETNSKEKEGRNVNTNNKTETPTVTQGIKATPANGKNAVMSGRTVVKEADLLLPIKSNISKSFTGAKIIDAFKNDANGNVTYEVHILLKAVNWNLIYSKDGRFLKKEEMASPKTEDKKPIAPRN